MSPTAVSTPASRALEALAIATEHKPHARVRELAAHMGVSTNYVSALLSTAERQGLTEARVVAGGFLEWRLT